MASLLLRKSSAGLQARPAAPSRAARAVQVRAESTSRPLWFPGNPAPKHLTGKLAGDYGFDPLNLGDDEQNLKWFVQAELVHGRFAMLGVAGILATALIPGLPQWYDAGKVVIEQGPPGYGKPVSFGTLVMVQAILFGWVEMKRLYDFRNPGSQGDGSFLGMTTQLKGKENGYPGGLFDPFKLAETDKYEEYKWKEIKNGRLAMVAFLGFCAQYSATGKGPLQNLADHLADPGHVTFTTNGVSLPYLP